MAMTIGVSNYLRYYYDKRNELLQKLESLSNVRGKKVLINVKDEKISIAKSVKNEYVRCINALNALEQEFKTEKKSIRYRRKLLEEIKKDLLKLSLAMGCTLAINSVANNSKKGIYNYRSINPLEYSIATYDEETMSLEEKNITIISEKDEVQVISEGYETYLNIYANYYHFDSDKVTKIAKKLTNNFSLDLMDVVGDTCIVTDDVETKCMVFINNLNRDKLSKPLKKLGYSKKDLIVDSNIEKISDDLILSNGLSYSQYLKRVSEAIDLDENYALAISLWETGWVTSPKATTKNNFGGLGGSNSLTYLSPEAGIIAYCCNLKEYERYNLHSLTELSGIYVNGKRSNPSQHWVKNVKWFYSEIVENPETYFPTEIDTYKTYKLNK